MDGDSCMRIPHDRMWAGTRVSDATLRSPGELPREATFEAGGVVSLGMQLRELFSFELHEIHKLLKQCCVGIPIFFNYVPVRSAITASPRYWGRKSIAHFTSPSSHESAHGSLKTSRLPRSSYGTVEVTCR